MKCFFACGLLFLNSLAMNAQSWQIFNTMLKATVSGDSLEIFSRDLNKTIILKADTAFLSSETGNVLYKEGNFYGALDQYDLAIRSEAIFFSISNLNDDYFLIEDESGYYLSLCEFPLNPITDRFESLEHISMNSINSQVQEELFIVRSKGKYGILYPALWGAEFLLVPKYDEIVLDAEVAEKGPFFYMRKGSKWGAVSTGGIEVAPKYERIKYICGNQGEASFIIWKKESCGVVRSDKNAPLIQPEYSEIAIHENEQILYLFMQKDGILDHIRYSPGCYDWDQCYEPVMVLKLGNESKVQLIYKAEEELRSMELSEIEVQRLGAITLDWYNLYN